MQFRPVCLVSLFFAVPLALASPDPELSSAPPGRIFELLALNHDLPTAARPKYLSPCALAVSPDSQSLFVAEQTAKQIGILDLGSKTVSKNVKLPNEPTGIAVSPDGSKLYVTCSSDLWPNGMVCEVDAAAGKVLRRLPAGQGARSPVVNHAGKTLYVCNQYENNVSVIDIGSGTEEAKIPSSRQPYAAAITPDDSVLVVGNLLPTEKATDTLRIASKILLIDAAAKMARDTLSLPVGSHSVLGVTVSPDGNLAFATHMISMFTIPGTKIDGGFIHTNNCAIVDLKKRKVINVATLDKSLSGKADPWGIDCSKDGKKLCIVHSGSNELSILDIPQLLSVASDTIQYTPELIVNPWKDTIALRRKFSALNGIHWNAPIAAKGPRTLTISAGKAYVAGYFGNQIEVFSLDSSSATAAGTISLGAPEVLTSERKGEQAFFDGNLCLQKWQTCHSCHAFSRMDGLNYYGNEDSWGPKNTTSILYSWWTPPTTWAGRRANTFESNRAEMKINLFLQPDQEKALTIDTFVQNLKPISSPFLVKGQLSGSAAKGKELFFGNAGCSRCHPAPLFTDLKKYNAGVVDLYDANTQWGTPSLVECWRTAPYGHMGDGLTVREMLDLPGMGAVSGKLTEEEVRQLVEFVLSL